MSAHDFAEYLERSLDLLAREVPQSVRRIEAALGARGIRFDVDRDSFVLHFSGGAAHLVRTSDPVDVRLGLDRAVVCDLVAGQISLEEALMADRLDLRAPIGSLDSFFEALRAYLDGAVRSPSLPILFDAYRRGQPVPESAEERP